MTVRSRCLEAIDQGVDSATFIASLGLEPCAGCGELVSLQSAGDAVLDKLCRPCGDAELARRRNFLPKGEALLDCGVPAKYRLEEPWLAADRWESDPVWPDKLLARDWIASYAGAWCFTLAGRNGSGKSMLASELLLAFWRTGARPATVPGVSKLPLSMWIRESTLAEEAEISGYGDLRTLDMACRISPVLVWDDLGTSWTTTRARRLCMDLIEERHAWRRPTIFTTHRPLSLAKAVELGVDEGQSIELAAPEIYSRLRAGWVGRWMEKTWRGTGDEIPA